MKAAIYCRVSTDNQEREGTSLQTQLEACRNYCQGKGYDVVCKLTYFELVTDSNFMDELTAALFLLHTNINNFPSVKTLLERGGQASTMTTNISYVNN